MCVNAGLDIKP